MDLGHKKNLLSQLYPARLIGLEEANFSKVLSLKTHLLPTKSGHETMRVSAGNTDRYLHSQHDPFKEANKQLKQTKIKDYATIIVLGNGLGYLTSLLAKTDKKIYRILVIEKRPEIFNHFLESGQAADLIANPKIFFLVNITLEKFKQHFLKNPLYCLGHIHFFTSPLINELDREYFQLITKIVTYNLEHFQVTTNTNVIYGKKITTNVLKNAAMLNKSASLESIKKIYANTPAICLGAGPSLIEWLPFLKEAQSSFLLFAVDTTLPLLLKNNIEPDFIVTADFLPKNLKYFENYFEQITKIPIIATLQCEPQIIDQHQGPFIYIYTHTVVEEALVSKLELPKFYNIANVTHLAYKIAEFLNCSPIIFCGMDLCFRGDELYSQGTKKDNLKIENIDGKKFLIQEKTISDQKLATAIVETLANNGSIVETTLPMLHYKNLLEQELKNSHTHLINTAINGVKINGLELISDKTKLEELLNKQTLIMRASFEKFKSKKYALSTVRQKAKRTNKLARKALVLLQEGKTEIAYHIEKAMPKDIYFKLFETMYFATFFHLKKLKFQSECTTNASTEILTDYLEPFFQTLVKATEDFLDESIPK